MALTENIMAILTFDKENIGSLADDESATLPAVLIALLVGFTGFIPDFLTFITSNDQTTRESALTSAITYLFVAILIFFVFSGIMGFVLRGFGGTATLIQCLRVFGYAQIWSLIGSIIDLVLSVLSISFGIEFRVILALVALAAFIVGLTSFSGLSLGSAIIAAIIAYVLTVILAMIIVGILVLILLAILLSALMP